MDIKFIYNFVFKLIFELIQSKELKTYYDVFFYELIDSIQKKKKKKQTSTPNKGKATRLNRSSFPAQTDYIPLTPVVPIGPTPTCKR